MTDKSSPSGSISWIERFKKLFTVIPKNREELLAWLREMNTHNAIDLDSLRMIEDVIQVSDMHVNEIMIPGSEMIVIPKDAEFEEILRIVIRSGHSRFPVIGDTKEEVIGIMLAKDLLVYTLEDISEKFSLRDILRPVVFVPESKRLNILLHEFRKSHQHIAIVVNEYGEVNGLVTIEDVLEQIVGNIEDEYDIDKDLYIRRHKDDSYSVKATTPIEEFNRYFHTQLPDEEFDTIGGLVLKGFGHLPKRKESIHIEGIPFTVLRANSRRIQLLQTTLVISEEPSKKED
jgi:magnesium and cobalt transporter